jgi:chemotaxis protein CheD
MDGMERIVDVQIGEVKVAQGNAILRSTAIGSCIAIVACDSLRKIGALAHIMLPGRAPARKAAAEKNKYASDAIEAIVEKMGKLGSATEDIEVAVVGGANILGREDDTICKDNIKSVLELLAEKGLKIKARAVGGTERRSVSLDIESGIVLCTEGNGRETPLWRTAETKD